MVQKYSANTKGLKFFETLYDLLVCHLVATLLVVICYFLDIGQ